MSSITDQGYLLKSQYRDSSNLDARIAVHRRFSSNQTGWFRWYLDQLTLTPPVARVLDLGCGPARLWCDQIGRVPKTWKITLADLSPGMTDQAQANLAAAGAANDRRFVFRTADAQRLPFEDNTFDVVLANHMLYHVPDIPQALQEIRRVLRPGGRLYAATNGDGHMAGLHDLLAPFTDGAPPPPGPERRFGLENGEVQLARWFTRVERRDYPDGLEISEAEPLVAYVLSTGGMLWMPSGEPSAGELARHFEALLARDGVIHIEKSTGLFVAVKLPRPEDADGDVVTLRPVVHSDLPVFFEQQLDWDAHHMAAVSAHHPADRRTFNNLWSMWIIKPSMVLRTILAGGQIAGYVMCTHWFREIHRVSYWLGREFWGRGIATQALALLLTEVERRPLYAHAAVDNFGSQRVLEKCGFKITGKYFNYSAVRGDLFDEFEMRLDRPAA